MTPARTHPLISVILPVHNQADHLQTIVGEYEEALRRLPGPHEVLLVEKGSAMPRWRSAGSWRRGSRRCGR